MLIHVVHIQSRKTINNESNHTNYERTEPLVPLLSPIVRSTKALLSTLPSTEYSILFLVATSSYFGGAYGGTVVSDTAPGTCATAFVFKLCLHDSLRMFSACRASKCSRKSFSLSLLAFRSLDMRAEQRAAQLRRSEVIVR
jgi:hypothetical protein